MTGVEGFVFDAVTGFGEISWWKNDPSTRDHPTLPYAGTIRTTSQVVLVLHVDLDDTDQGSSLDAELMAAVRHALASLDSDTEFAELLTILTQHHRPDNAASAAQGHPQPGGFAPTDPHRREGGVDGDEQ
ncbi:hypothetical protein [Glutamicibacter protophormiae]|uniref:hypothetical protein n=1 Tax=Glutamicibacter protophormiae TaxID=37930 RepID=UPI003A8FBD46